MHLLLFQIFRHFFFLNNGMMSNFWVTKDPFILFKKIYPWLNAGHKVRPYLLKLNHKVSPVTIPFFCVSRVDVRKLICKQLGFFNQVTAGLALALYLPFSSPYTLDLICLSQYVAIGLRVYVGSERQRQKRDKQSKMEEEKRTSRARSADAEQC
jgi:hypothetical protein